jgi:hypothetical protein
LRKIAAQNATQPTNTMIKKRKVGTLKLAGDVRKHKFVTRVELTPKKAYSSHICPKYPNAAI